MGMRGLLTAVGFALAFWVAGVQAQPPMNVVVIVADDLSVDAFEALLDSTHAPNLRDRLVAQGISFTNAFVTNAECCPSRATLLRGQYSHNHGVLANQSPDPFVAGIGWPGWLPSGSDPGAESSTIATWAQAAGYTTGYIGKYLNGYGRVAPDGVTDPRTYVPPGWDDWQGLIDPTTYRMYEYELNDNGVVVAYGSDVADYQTDVLADRTAEFLDERGVDGAPFLLVVSPLAPHVEILDPLDVVLSADYLEAFETSIRPAERHEHLVDADTANGEVPELIGKGSFNEQDVSDKPSCPMSTEPEAIVTYNVEPLCPGDLPRLGQADIDRVRSQYKHMLASMVAVDELLGRVLDKLDQLGMADRTIVVFMSDNGHLYGEHRASGKGVPYEESIRVPLVVRSPLASGPASVDGVVLNNDLAPTIAELTSASPTYEPDGRSLVPLLADPDTAAWDRKRFLVERWYIPSLLKFEMASYSALRNLVGVDILYVAWRTDPAQPGVVTDREFYSIAADPDQRAAVALPASVTQVLDKLSQLLRGCAGATCKNAEDM